MVKDAEEERQTPSLARIRTLFNEGKVDQALVFAQTLEAKKPDAIKNAGFALLYAQILIEVDAPSSKLRSILNHAIVVDAKPVLVSHVIDHQLDFVAAWRLAGRRIQQEWPTKDLPRRASRPKRSKHESPHVVDRLKDIALAGCIRAKDAGGWQDAHRVPTFPPCHIPNNGRIRENGGEHRKL
jgi:hypothetical protein